MQGFWQKAEIRGIFRKRIKLNSKGTTPSKHIWPLGYIKI